MRTAKVNIYSYNELSPEAKEKARSWFREDYPDYEWWDAVYDDAKRIGKILGITIKEIYFSGFWSQGDGSCFEGDYQYNKNWKKELKAYAPTDADLLAIGKRLQDEQKEHKYKIAAHTHKHSHQYCHENTVTTEAYDVETGNFISAPYVGELFKMLMRWIYQQLEKEYEHQTSDEVVEENIIANGYEFTANGKVWSMREADDDTICAGGTESKASS